MMRLWKAVAAAPFKNELGDFFASAVEAEAIACATVVKLTRNRAGLL